MGRSPWTAADASVGLLKAGVGIVGFAAVAGILLGLAASRFRRPKFAAA